MNTTAFSPTLKPTHTLNSHYDRRFRQNVLRLESFDQSLKIVRLLKPNRKKMNQCQDS